MDFWRRDANMTTVGFIWSGATEGNDVRKSSEKPSFIIIGCRDQGYSCSILDGSALIRKKLMKSKQSTTLS